MELSDMTGVRTESEGDGSLKFMVIIPVEPGGREE
jgi:predicted RNA-binding protein Jag